MVFYQCAIMAAVVFIIYLIASVFKVKNRTVLVISILVLIFAGGIGLYAVQNYFGAHIYTQKIDSSLIERLQFTQSEKENVRKIFSDYEVVSGNGSPVVLSKTYAVNGKGARSSIEVNICLFGSKKGSDSYFNFIQKIHDKNYLPPDPSHSLKTEGRNLRYITTFIKSSYDDYDDIIYVPSKISYSSDLTIEDGSMIIALSEKSNRPVTNKDTVIHQILAKL